MHDKKNWRWIDPDTNVIYDLNHLRSFVTSFDVKLAKDSPKKTNIETRVIFSNHCYSKTRSADDNDDQILTRYGKYDGTIEERVFCPRRWEFSKQLPKIMRQLVDKHCLAGNSNKILYRQEHKKTPGGHDGWYICIRLEYRSKRTPQVELWVRSAHWRPNRPINIRGHGNTRFCLLLSQYLKSRLG